MKLIIAGSRSFSDHYFYLFIDLYMKEVGEVPQCVICGEASGIDALGKKWAIDNNIPVNSMPADWAQYGNAAGPIRNAQMAKEGTHLLLLWDGKSKGSKNMLSQAEKNGIIIYEIIL